MISPQVAARSYGCVTEAVSYRTRRGGTDAVLRVRARVCACAFVRLWADGGCGCCACTSDVHANAHVHAACARVQ